MVYSNLLCFFSSRRRHASCALVTGVQTCALPISSAYAHKAHDEALRADGKLVVDLTPAAIGPFTIPPVNMEQNLEATNVNMVTCGGQATIPMVAAVSQVAKVHYAEIVASVSSRSAGPGARKSGV